MSQQCNGWPVAKACIHKGNKIADWALHDIEGRKLCDSCSLSYYMNAHNEALIEVSRLQKSEKHLLKRISALEEASVH